MWTQMAATASALCILCAGIVQASEPPVILGANQAMIVVRLPDGTLMGNFTRTVDDRQVTLRTTATPGASRRRSLSFQSREEPGEDRRS